MEPGLQTGVAMFPLGSVLLPSAVMPLHIFEPRYRMMMQACLDRGREFGVTLIERGSEVGGGDRRMPMGCIAQIVEAEEFEDGRWFIAAVGTRRFTVNSWIGDDPYPIADVDVCDELPAADDDEPLVEQARAALDRVNDLRAQLGASRQPEQRIVSGDAALASFQIGALAPVGPLDRYRILTTDVPGDRLRLLIELLGDQQGDLEAQLALG